MPVSAPSLSALQGPCGVYCLTVCSQQNAFGSPHLSTATPLHTHTHTHKHTHTHTCAHIHMQSPSRCTHTHTQSAPHTHAHTHTHTHRVNTQHTLHICMFICIFY